MGLVVVISEDESGGEGEGEGVDAVDGVGRYWA